MNLAYFYEGARLLSIPYCEREIKKLEERLYEAGYNGVNSEDEEVKLINGKIFHYKNILRKMHTSLGKLNVYRFSKVITEEICKKLKDCSASKVLVIFSYVDAYTMEILVGNVFSTELFSRELLYDVKCSFGKYSNDQCLNIGEYTSVLRLTHVGKSIVANIEKVLTRRFPDIDFEFRQSNG